MSNINFFRMMAGNGASSNPAQIPCNAGSISFAGGPGYFESEAVVLGEGIGAVTCSFNSRSVPDRFRLVWSGSTVADSSIVGDSLKTIGGYSSSMGSLTGSNVLNKYNWQNSQGIWTTGSTTETVVYTTASFPPQSSDNGLFRRNNASSATGSALRTLGGLPTSPTGSGAVNYIYDNPGWKVENGIHGYTSNVTDPIFVSPGSLELGNWGAQKGVLPNSPVFSGPNYSASCVDGNVQLTFYKHTKFPSSFKIIVEGIPGTTVWDLFSVSCPTGATVNSSSLKLSNGAAAATVVYHTAPTFDLRPGMKCYYDIALTQPVSSSAVITTTTNYQNETFSNEQFLLTPNYQIMVGMKVTGNGIPANSYIVDATDDSGEFYGFNQNVQFYQNDTYTYTLPNKSLIVSGSLPTNPPSSGYVGDQYSFANPNLENTQGFLTFYDGSDDDLKGMILTASACTSLLVSQSNYP